MKLNKNKIIVSALALAIGGSLAGSVGSTIAWYQYSTRANVSFLGQASGVSGNLQMRFAGENDTKWRTRITKEEMEANMVGGTKLVPMTFGGVDLNGELPEKGYTQPLPGVQAMNGWYEAATANYAQFTLQMRYVERDGVKEGGKDDKNAELPVYISKMLIQEDGANGEKGDLSDAVRVHVATSYNDGSAKKEYRLISNQGGTTITHGKLDIDGDGKKDTYFPGDDEFGFEHTQDELVEVDYGAGTQTTLKADATGGTHQYFDETDTAVEETVYPACVGTEANTLKLSGTSKQTIPNVGDVEKYVGKTMESEDTYLSVTVTVWVEGWHRFDYSAREGSPKYMALWDADLIGAKFDLGIQFAVDEQ